MICWCYLAGEICCGNCWKTTKTQFSANWFAWNPSFAMHFLCENPSFPVFIYADFLVVRQVVPTTSTVSSCIFYLSCVIEYQNREKTILKEFPDCGLWKTVYTLPLVLAKQIVLAPNWGQLNITPENEIKLFCQVLILSLASTMCSNQKDRLMRCTSQIQIHGYTNTNTQEVNITHCTMSAGLLEPFQFRQKWVTYHGTPKFNAHFSTRLTQHC